MKGLTGGTVPARIWKDIMVVATKDLGAKDFDYPEIDLENYHKGFGKAKVIGDDENPSNEGKVVESETAATGEASSSEDQAQNADKNSADTPAASDTKSAPKSQSAPVPPKQISKGAPIPMAVPDSLR